MNMRFFKTIALCTVLPLMASACEGPCINGTCNKFIEKYEVPVKAFEDRINVLINTKFQLPDSTNCASSLIDDYRSSVYPKLEYAIFPAYFHGKCQRYDSQGNFVDPAGCPDPDCPVVCGTAGSLVHFYTNLTEIVYGCHTDIFANLTQLNTPTRNKLQTCIQDAAQRCSESPPVSPSSRSLSRLFASLVNREGGINRNSPRGFDSCYNWEPDAAQKALSDILNSTRNIWSGECDEKNGLRKCSWKEEMTKYILSMSNA